MSSKRAKAHANHGYFCTCGRIVHGNGGRANHRDMHKRNDDGHRFTTREGYDILFPDWWQLPHPAKTARKIEGPRSPQVGSK